MTSPTPTPLEAEELIATADRLGRAVRDGSSWRYVSWLAGTAVANLMYLTALGVVGTDTAVLVISAAFGVCLLGLSLALLPGVRVNKAGFSRRWIAAVVGWGVAYALTMGLGVVFFRGELAFWLPAAAISTLPLVLGARAEAKA